MTERNFFVELSTIFHNPFDCTFVIALPCQANILKTFGGSFSEMFDNQKIKEIFMRQTKHVN